MRTASICLLVASTLSACGDSGTTPSGGSGGNANGGSGGDDGSGGQPTAGSPSSGGATAGGGGAAGGEGGGEAGINGSAGKGPLISGSSVVIAALDVAGEPTGAQFSTVTSDALGNFGVPVNVSGPARIEASGFFFNELLVGLSSAPVVLRALVEVDGSVAQTVNVNTLTHLTQKRAFTLWQGGASLSDARTQAYSELVAAFEVGAPGFVPGIDAADASLVDGDSDGAAYLLAVSAIVLDIATVAAEGGPVEPELSQLLDQLATDLEDDGDLTAARKLEIHDSEARLDANGIVTALSDYLVQQGSAAVVPNINRALDQDFDSYANIDDCLPLDPLRWTGNADLDLDTFDAIACGGLDCNDELASISPSEPDSAGDTIDNNCDGLDGVDFDQDGLASIASGGNDCDDTDAAVGEPWQLVYQVGQMVMDAAGNHYGYLGGNIVTDATGPWTTFPAPPGLYERLLTESDGTLHLVGNLHAVFSGGSWTVLGSGAPTEHIVVDDSGALHYVRNPQYPIYGTNSSGSFVETQLTLISSATYGIGLDSTGPVICYWSGSAKCVRPNGTTIFDVPAISPAVGERAMAIAADDSIYLAHAYGELKIFHWQSGIWTQDVTYTPEFIIFFGLSLVTVGDDAYVVATNAPSTTMVASNASGAWQELPSPSPTGCSMVSSDAEVGLTCNGSLYELTPGCTP